MDHQKISFLSLILVLLTLSGTYSQNQVKKELSEALETIKVDIENRLPDSAVLPILKKLRKKAIDHKLYYEGATTFLLESNQHFLNSNWEKALETAKMALQIGNTKLKGRYKTEIQVKALNSIGFVYSYQGDFTEGLSMRLKALQVADLGICSKKDMGDLLSWIADDYRHLEQYDKALEYLKKTTAYLQYVKNEVVIDYYYTYCQTLNGLEKYKEAKEKLAELDAFISTEKKFTENDKNVGNLQSSKLHGEFALKDKNYNEAIAYYQKYLLYSIKIKSNGHISIAYYKLARAFQFSGNKKLALYYYKKSYDICLQEKFIDYAFKNANAMAAIYAESNDYKNAFRYSESAFILKDSLNASERIKELHFLEAKYQSGKKEKEIAELKLKTTKQELQVIQRNRILLIGGIVSSFVLILFVFLFYLNRQKRIIAEKEKQSLEQKQQVVILQAMVEGQEKERSRIAKDLHDSMGGTFSTIKMHLSTLEHQIKNEEQLNLLEKCIGIISNASSDLRRVAHNMMPEVLIKLGLLHSIEELVSNINSSKQVKVTFQYFGFSQRLLPTYEIMIYRIIQELINNIIKHSNATETIIQFIKEGENLNITVEDNGKGFSIYNHNDGIGLNSIKERVHYLNGNLTIDSQENIGTTIMMEFSLKNTH